MALIFIIEDEVKISEILSDYLVKYGYMTRTLDSGEHAVSEIIRYKPDLVILDLMLPEVSGFTICTQLREIGIHIPVIMLTARVDEADRVKGLDIGADDYVCKPFLPNEVVARVNAHLRRVQLQNETQENTDSLVSFRNLTLDMDRLLCFVNGNEIELTPVELRLLYGMVQQPRRIFSRDMLMQLCYDDDRVINDRTIDSHMRNIRRKLVGAENLIQTVYGEGYRIEAKGG